ncbi:hypothetical protein OEZ86_008587 [Tetradesmus obliquus]|nr:hypothetical protein OEZ86_008587 [Tetradesmus obliquus]
MDDAAEAVGADEAAANVADDAAADDAVDVDVGSDEAADEAAADAAAEDVGADEAAADEAAADAAADAADNNEEDEAYEEEWGYAAALGAALSGCPGLSSLAVHDAAGADGALLLRALPGLTGLTSLDLSGICASSSHWSYMRDPRGLPCLPRLRHLAFGTAWPLAVLAGGMGLLTSLTSLQ